MSLLNYLKNVLLQETSELSEFKEFFEDQILKNNIPNILDEDDIYPSFREVFSAFDGLSFDTVRVVILGQDPYPGVDKSGVPHAHGLAFSSNSRDTPKSLNNIFKEIKNNYATTSFETNNLRNWQSQGVLLLNTSLTVERGKADSHSKLKYWNNFIDDVLREINNRSNGNIVCMLWGNHAKKYASLLSNCQILEASHPSPLSATSGFFGCNHFRICNEILLSQGDVPIDWCTK